MSQGHYIHEHSGMQPMTGWVYLYGLAHPTTREIRYVGRAVNPSKRYTVHLRATHGTKGAWIGALRQRNKKPILIILAVVPQYMDYQMESLLIRLFGLQGRLLNGFPGIGSIYKAPDFFNRWTS